MLPWAPARQACKTELAHESRHLQEQDQSQKRPHAFPSPLPTGLGLDDNREGKPSLIRKSLPCSDSSWWLPSFSPTHPLIPTLELGPEPHAWLPHTETKPTAGRLFRRALPLQSGRQQSGAGLALLSSHCVPGLGLGIQLGTGMGKGLSREAL